MKFDPIECQIRGYIAEGTEVLKSRNLNISVPRHTRNHYIGMSSATKCGRYLWVDYYHPILLPPRNVDARVSRIFDLGHICEDIILQTLKLGGAEISGEQTFMRDFDGVFRGHCDCVINAHLIGEIKSMNDASYEKFCTMDLQTSHFAYYIQLQLYEHYSGLKDGVLIATNKNTSAAECQRIKYDQTSVDFHRKKIETVVNAKSFFDIDQPYTVESKKDCEFCPLKKICYVSD